MNPRSDSQATITAAMVYVGLLGLLSTGMVGRIAYAVRKLAGTAT